MRRLTVTTLLAAGLVCTHIAPAGAQLPGQQSTGTRPPDVVWIPTERAVVDAMLRMAKVTKDDVVYDLGCGDGKIVIAAAVQYGARGVGIDIDPARVKDANAAVKAAGVEHLVTIVQGDIFDPAVKIGDATVVTLYLLQRLNEQLKPRLLRELRPGTRIVSNAFHMGADWPAERTQQEGYSTIYLWTIPGRRP
jgi:ribosomal protein L11 methylase PrmA